MENLKSFVEACFTCVVSCEICITDCIKNGNQECISLCRDCADICALCARFDARGSAYGYKLHQLCAEICNACSIECAKHASQHDSCKECAEACKKCAEACEELTSAN